MAHSNVWAGAVVGYAASRTMDRATGLFFARQSEASKRREEELAPGGTLLQLGKQLGGVVGRELDDERAEALGILVHRTLGMGYGVLASLLVRRGVRPIPAGLAVGTAAFLVVDEGTALPTLRDYPWESHLRGVVGHGTVGLAIGVLLALLERP